MIATVTLADINMPRLRIVSPWQGIIWETLKNPRPEVEGFSLRLLPETIKWPSKRVKYPTGICLMY